MAGTRLLAPEGTTSGASIVSEVPETTPEGMTVPGEKVAFCKFVPAGSGTFDVDRTGSRDVGVAAGLAGARDVELDVALPSGVSANSH